MNIPIFHVHGLNTFHVLIFKAERNQVQDRWHVIDKYRTIKMFPIN